MYSSSESLLCELEEKWPQVNLQTSCKLEPCYKFIAPLSSGSVFLNDNITDIKLANSATTTVVEPFTSDNAGATTGVNAPVIDDGAIVYTSPKFYPTPG